MPKGVVGRLPALEPQTSESGRFARVQAAPSVQIIARDAFVADMVIKVEQVQREVRALVCEVDAIKATIERLREETERNYRFSVFQESEQRAKSTKLDDLLRRYNDLKKRVDEMGGTKDGDYHLYNSFEAISRKLTEFGALQREFRNSVWNLKVSAGLFSASVLLWLCTLLSG
jgi:predicted RNase H-like nuclease (RuvC/YqgF family)